MSIRNSAVPRRRGSETEQQAVRPHPSHGVALLKSSKRSSSSAILSAPSPPRDTQQGAHTVGLSLSHSLALYKRVSDSRFEVRR